ncbi:PREDICTED: synaptophysin-like protein 1 [Amphimedon queenslandica]|uniref:MARVEL domain-containing protein n=1 Tax=Amphimedon queenslandica TaxID=400682 RepID=A0A1X7VBT7_AMPQE|nr:PREDICTED: synaptophysin-like protein 1 [Amphimedon queenslandica]|eukprot:XP_003384954.2 PREDICTED: synaptophysin-like protein 1 [Amphimedon queenslandica]
MSEGQVQDGGRLSGARGTLEKLGDIKIGQKISINLRILLEPIGFLRIILIFLCLLAFSLTAGFSSSGSTNQARCNTNNLNISATVTLTFSYPYRANSFSFTYDPPLNDSAPITCFTADQIKTFSGSAEYYVFMTTVTFIYGILAVVVYIFFYVPRYDIAKYLSVADLIGTSLLAFFFIFANIAWSAGSFQLENYTVDLLNSRRTDCIMCQDVDTLPPAAQNFAQPSVSLLFGWVAMLLLIASIWFVYKDTIIHLNRMGPLYKLPFIHRRYRQRQGGREGEDKYTEEQGQGEEEKERGGETVEEGDKW